MDRQFKHLNIKKSPALAEARGGSWLFFWSSVGRNGRKGAAGLRVEPKILVFRRQHLGLAGCDIDYFHDHGDPIVGVDGIPINVEDVCSAVQDKGHDLRLLGE